tara:strand:+ start:22168 stop:22473 length:306 start_codon:yes stop_codon:yes gene_type:complete
MLLIIDGVLCEPPSETTLFRDITLFASVFREKEVLLECEKEMKDIYYKWLKSRGAYDFVKDIVSYNKEQGFTIRYKFNDVSANLKIRRIGYHNFDRILDSL